MASVVPLPGTLPNRLGSAACRLYQTGQSIHRHSFCTGLPRSSRSAVRVMAGATAMEGPALGRPVGLTSWSHYHRFAPFSRKGQNFMTFATEKESAEKIESSIPDTWKGLPEKEILRRQRISNANKGRCAWNTGRKHSEETKRKIRERTKAAMQRPEVIAKLKAMPHPKHSDEVKRKIRASLVVFYDRAGRKGRPKLTEEEKEERRKAASLKRKATLAKNSARTGGTKIRVPLSEDEIARKKEQRNRKIAASVKAKWMDPSYRQKTAKGKRIRALENEEKHKADMLTQQRQLVRARSKELLEKASLTVAKLEKQLEAVKDRPELAIRVQGALEHARGVKLKAEARAAQLEMEIVMAKGTAQDSWEIVEDSCLAGHKTEQPAEPTTTPANGTAVNALQPSAADDKSPVNGAMRVSPVPARTSGLNGHPQLAVNGHGLNGNSTSTGCTSSAEGMAVAGEPLINGSRVRDSVFTVEASVPRGTSLKTNGADVTGPVDLAEEEEEAGLPGPVGEDDRDTELMWKNGRLVRNCADESDNL